MDRFIQKTSREREWCSRNEDALIYLSLPRHLIPAFRVFSLATNFRKATSSLVLGSRSPWKRDTPRKPQIPRTYYASGQQIRRQPRCRVREFAIRRGAIKSGEKEGEERRSGARNRGNNPPRRNARTLRMNRREFIAMKPEARRRDASTSRPPAINARDLRRCEFERRRFPLFLCTRTKFPIIVVHLPLSRFSYIFLSCKRSCSTRFRHWSPTQAR